MIGQEGNIVKQGVRHVVRRFVVLFFNESQEVIVTDGGAVRILGFEEPIGKQNDLTSLIDLEGSCSVFGIRKNAQRLTSLFLGRRHGRDLATSPVHRNRIMVTRLGIPDFAFGGNDHVDCSHEQAVIGLLEDSHQILVYPRRQFSGISCDGP